MEKYKCITCLKRDVDSCYAECGHYTHCKQCIKTLCENNDLCKKCPTCTKVSAYIHTCCTGKCKNITTLALTSNAYWGYVCNQCSSGTSSIIYDNIKTRKKVLHDAILLIAKPVPDKYMKPLLLSINKAVTENQWISAFREYYELIEKDAKDHNTHYLFTSDQMKSVGQIMHKIPLSDENYWMRNVMVALCLFPWEMPYDPFTHGLCYFGNFGETPVSSGDALGIVERNISLWDQMGFNIRP